jgi:hypothetical protein
MAKKPLPQFIEPMMASVVIVLVSERSRPVANPRGASRTRKGRHGDYKPV